MKKNYSKKNSLSEEDVFKSDLEEQNKYLETLVNAEKDLDLWSQTLQSKEAFLNKINQENKVIESKIEQFKQDALVFKTEFEKNLENKSQYSKQSLYEVYKQKTMEEWEFDLKRWKNSYIESKTSQAKKESLRFLETIDARYCPNFFWPKPNLLIYLPNQQVVKKYQALTWLPRLTEMTGCTIDIIEDTEESYIRVAQGGGLEKEALRLALEDMIKHSVQTEEKAVQLYDKYTKILENYCLQLGKDAVKELRLKTFPHHEILKLIGMLNYRTSHRQNQYFHSKEVSFLSGMIAHEMGIDIEIAKRAGLLHDIGKALDYKIDGGHAVISADYAQRYGESEEIIDTILAHHDDKIVETPHAYVLKTADAMSGGRPGARVHGEEGYQKKLEKIQEILKEFYHRGMISYDLMHAGREVRIFVNPKKVTDEGAVMLARDIINDLELKVDFPGQITVTLIRKQERIMDIF